MQCLNCHTEFEGNYCPHCGQSASTSRFTKRSVLSSTLEVWGMGTRSIPRTLYHLFTSPGRMIGDYLDGHRMPFFQPIKMLFVLCIFYAVVSSLTGRETSASKEKPFTKELGIVNPDMGKAQEKTVFNYGIGTITLDATFKGFERIVSWFDRHMAVSLISLHFLFTVFTCRVFRHSPIRPRSTLPENFFAQVYISCQLVALSMVYILLFGNKGSAAFYPLPGFVLFALFTWDFKQLFGHSWKKTIWLTALVHLYTFMVLALICCCVVAVLIYALAKADVLPAS